MMLYEGMPHNKMQAKYLKFFSNHRYETLQNGDIHNVTIIKVEPRLIFVK